MSNIIICPSGTFIPDSSGLPEVDASDNGKVMMVVNGEWAVAELPNGTDIEY